MVFQEDVEYIVKSFRRFHIGKMTCTGYNGQLCAGDPVAHQLCDGRGCKMVVFSYQDADYAGWPERRTAKTSSDELELKKYICNLKLNLMAKSTTSISITEEKILNKIYYFRGYKVMLDQDLSELYQVPTKRLNEQVKRNAGRFPADFMFHLTEEEFEDLRSQIATSSWGGRWLLRN